MFNVSDGIVTNSTTKKFTTLTGPGASGFSFGWKLISVCVNESVYKTNSYLRVRNSTNNYTWTQATANGIVLDFIYNWSDTSQVYLLSDHFEGYLGHWVYFYNITYDIYYNETGGNATGCASIDDALDFLNNHTTYDAGLTFDTNQYVTILFIVVMFFFAYTAETAPKTDHTRRGLNFFAAGIIALFGGVSITQFLPWYYSFTFLTIMSFYWLRAAVNLKKIKKIT
jgi:hypothetical protein